MQYAINPNKKTLVFFEEYSQGNFHMNLTESQYESLLQFHCQSNNKN